MFTGIIEEKGTLIRIESTSTVGKIYLHAKKVLEGTRIGDSIAVNGVCLTVVELFGKGFAADIMPETLKRCNLGKLSPGSSVNLERAMAADGRFGGHLVSGHIDGTGKIAKVWREQNAVWYTIDTPKELMRYIVEKGSVALDGTSLTVAETTETSFSISIIPHTLEETILAEKKAGDTVNLENDIIGKYVEHFMQPGYTKGKQESALTREFLLKSGF